MKDRFDLESDISNLINYPEQIRLVSNSFSEGRLTEDQMLNALEGIAVLLELHQEKIFDSFKQSFNLDEYKDCI